MFEDDAMTTADIDYLHYRRAGYTSPMSDPLYVRFQLDVFPLLTRVKQLYNVVFAPQVNIR